MTLNELGYLVREWDRHGYGFCTEPFYKSRNYVNYLRYYVDPKKNVELWRRLMKEHDLKGRAK